MTGLLAQADAAASGSAEVWVFIIVGSISLGSAIAMVLMRNPVHAALMLVVNLFTIAAFYAVLEAQFLAVVQIIVYAGAIMVLFLFVIMLLGVDRTDVIGGPMRHQPVAAVLTGLLLFGALAFAVAGPLMGSGSACTPQAAAQAGQGAIPCAGLADVNDPETGGNVAALGRLLFTDYVWPFEVTSVLLVIAALGAMVLGRRTELAADLVDRAEQPVPAGSAPAPEPQPAPPLPREGS